MATTREETIAELQRAIAELRQERDAALASRASDYSEQAAHQAANIDVLKAMAASTGDPQPVFDLVVERARDLCDLRRECVGIRRHADPSARVERHRRRPGGQASGRSNLPDAAVARAVAAGEGFATGGRSLGWTRRPSDKRGHRHQS